MDATTAKIVSLSCLLVLSLFFGTLPYCLLLRRSESQPLSRQRQKIIKFINSFAGGVFLGALFLSLITEGGEEFEKYKKKVEYDSDFPFFSVLILVGFFLTSSVEHVAHSVLAPRQHSSAQKIKSYKGEETQNLHNGRRKDYGSIDEPRSAVTETKDLANDKSHTEEIIKSDPSETVGQASFMNDEVNDRVSLIDGVSFSSWHTNSTSGMSYIKSLLLLLALSFHSIFDGLALGLQDTAPKVWQIFLAVSIHKSVVAFCLGLELFMNSSRAKIAAAFMAIFSLISPIGIVIGISVTSTGLDETAQLLSSSILQGLACGAFCYVTFMEILHSSWKEKEKSFLDIIFAFIGCAVMTVAKFWD